jgi:triphosphoribosyl-dephospho-CoA synthase
MMADVEILLKELFSRQPSSTDTKLGYLVETVCLLEVCARKPGNVHPTFSFADTTIDDFISSAQAIAPVFDSTESLSVGELVFQSVNATKHATGKNTNLGIILALAPLAKAATPNQPAIQRVLDGLTIEDAELVYQAIRLASPGGLGTAEQQDVRSEPTVTLLQAMRLAADRDLIAKQYANAFEDVFGLLLPELVRLLSAQVPLEQAIVQTFLLGLSRLGDTLILRKCGPALMAETKQRAGEVLNALGGVPRFAGTPANRACSDMAISAPQAIAPELAPWHECEELRRFDDWLRADGHRRNPGTMADLIAATLFLALRRGSISVPASLHWSCPALSVSDDHGQ